MNHLKHLILTFAFLTLSVSAQELPPTIMQSVKIDEFAGINYSDLMARLDQAAMQMQNDPASKMTIISYRDSETPVGKTIRTFKFMKNYLTRNRGIDSSRMKFIDGGETEAGFVFEVWIVPAGTEEPVPLKPINNSLNNPRIARKFDSDYYPLGDSDEYSDGDTFTEYAEKIKREPSSTAYVILYPTYYKYDDSDESTAAIDSPRKISQAKVALSRKLRKAGIPASRFKIVNGGYRDYRQVELWILPKGVAPPAATPNAFPKIQRKSGK